MRYNGITDAKLLEIMEKCRKQGAIEELTKLICVLNKLRENTNQEIEVTIMLVETLVEQRLKELEGKGE